MSFNFLLNTTLHFLGSICISGFNFTNKSPAVAVTSPPSVVIVFKSATNNALTLLEAVSIVKSFLNSFKYIIISCLLLMKSKS